MAQKPPTPIVRRQNFKRLVHENTTPLRCGKLATVVIQVVKRLDVVDQLPRLARSNDRRRKRQRVKRDIIFAHELDIAHIIRPFVRAPPPFPFGVVRTARIRPFLGTGNVLNGRVKPDVKHLVFHTRPRVRATFNRHTPIQIACDAAILQTVSVIQPLLGD